MSPSHLVRAVAMAVVVVTVSPAYGQSSAGVTVPPPSASAAAESASPSLPPAPLPILLVGIEPRWEGRFYRHTEFTAPNLRSYDASGYPALAIAAELYPLAHLASWRDLGITFQYVGALGLRSNSARLGQPEKKTLPVDTSFVRYAIGLRYRIRVEPQNSRSMVLAVSAAFGGWDFDFGPELPSGPDLEAPTAHHRMVRLGFDAAVPIAPVTFRGAVTYLHAFSVQAPRSREVDDLQYLHLPTAIGEGVELRLGASLPLWRSLELRLALEYALLVFHLQTLQGRDDVPARVVDSYVSLGLGPYVSF